MANRGEYKQYASLSCRERGTVALIPIPFIFRIEKWEESGERERFRCACEECFGGGGEEGGQDDEKNGGNRVHKVVIVVVVVGGIVVRRGGA